MIQPYKSNCSVCDNELPGEISPRRMITGAEICDECLGRLGADNGIPLFEFLDRLKVPVLVVDEDVVALGANTSLLNCLGKDLSQVKSRRGGNVFECAYAHLPEGCGRTVHCSGCAIRRAVNETFVTGKSLNKVAAYLNRDMATQFLQLGLLISTEKALGVVLLRIDYVGPADRLGEVRDSQ